MIKPWAGDFIYGVAAGQQHCHSLGCALFMFVPDHTGSDYLYLIIFAWSIVRSSSQLVPFEM